MGKIKGSYKSSANIEVTITEPLDPRVKWSSWGSLCTFSDWPVDANNNPYLYAGLIVAVNDGNEENPDWNVYVLNNTSGWNTLPTETGSGWKKVGGGGEIKWEE